MRTQTMEAEQKTVTLPAWQLTESTFEPETNLVHETLFALGNGFMGLRGSHEEEFEELAGTTLEGNFINGFYEASPMHYPETGYAFAQEHQFMLNVPNTKSISFSLDTEQFDIFKGKIINYNRSIDFRHGILERNLEWMSPQGKHIKVRSRRLVSFSRKNIFAIEYEISSVNFTGTLELISGINGLVKNRETGTDVRFGVATRGQTLQLIESEQKENFSALIHKTRSSGLSIISAIDNEVTLSTNVPIRSELITNDQRLEQVFEIQLKPGETARLVKYGAYITSQECKENKLSFTAKEQLTKAKEDGFEVLVAEQEKYLADFWHVADIEIKGNEALHQALHFSQFHLLQSVGRDGRTSIAAKGLTGEGYGGHYFWDAEIYALPFYLYTSPEIARKMLEYRYSILDKARQRAAEMSHCKGALFAWRTIAGEECSGYYPAGTAQYHINADIAYAIRQYYESTGDEEFLRKYGAEIVLETARIWMDIGAYIENKGGKFCINEVTGPDEYTALVNNNLYTNAMARMHLRFANELYTRFKKEYPEDFKRIVKATDLAEDEPKNWQHAADNMYMPYDKKLGIHAQDDSFLDRAIWDLKSIPKEKHPLILHYHYLVIYRYQICKQADVVLAEFLLGDEFNFEDKKRDYDYYEAITTHDSSLSLCTYSIMASEIGYHDKAYEYFAQTARGDLDNLHGNTSHGVHIAAMAGTWLAVINGFAGMRVYDAKIQFAPYLPDAWEHYTFKVCFRGRLLKISVGKTETIYELVEGEPLEFKHYGKPVKLVLGETKALPIVEHLQKQPCHSEAHNKIAEEKGAEICTGNV